MFLQACVSLFTGGCIPDPPSAETPCSRHAHSRQPPPTAKHSRTYGQRVGSMHPTGMEYCYIFFLLFKINVSETGGSDHLFLFTYANCLFLHIGFCFNIQYLFIYLFKGMSTEAAQVTTCFYLLMEIDCWLHVVFVLIFSIYLFTYSKVCQQKQCKSPPVFIYLWKLIVDYMWFLF